MDLKLDIQIWHSAATWPTFLISCSAIRYFLLLIHSTAINL